MSANKIKSNQRAIVAPLEIHKTLKQNLPPQVQDTSKDELHITEDGGIYISQTNGTLKQIGVDTETKNKIDDLVANKPDLTGYMAKDDYASHLDGVVKKSLTSNEIDGIQSSQNSTYYGKDEHGVIGFFNLPKDVSGDVGSLTETNEMFRIQLMKVQFKYDTALGLTRNNCGEYHIDTLEDNSGVAEFDRCSYDGVLKVIN